MGASAMRTLEQEMELAEERAWESLARYKFQMFGYWAAIWVHLNRISGLRRPNPFRDLVARARARPQDLSIRWQPTGPAEPGVSSSSRDLDAPLQGEEGRNA